MKKKKILMMLALLCAVAQGAWADEVTTQCTDGVFSGFTATGGSNTGDGGYAKLVDGNTATKWCTNTSPFYIEFHSSAPFVPTGYIMTTGGDTQSYSGRNPKSWTIKAKAHAEDDWTTLVTVENDATMPAKNYEPVSFAISGNTTAYQYFRLDVSATRGDSWFQLSEFQFTGTSYERTDGVFTGFTATAGAGSAGPDNGGYTKLVDGNTSTKWLTTSSPFYIEFHSSAPFVPTGYIMTTAEAAAPYSGRNPKSWTIKAKVNADDAEWTTLATVTDDATMPAKNYEPVSFAISGNTTAYQYFRLDVSATQSGNAIQLSEFQFTGTSYDLSYATVTGVYSLYKVPPTPSITPVVTIPGQPTLTFGTDFTATLNGTDVLSLPITISETGDYTLTLTGTGSYAGTKSINFRVVGPGDTEYYPITIGSTDDWNTFASNVSGGNSYSGKFVKLTSNISVSTMARGNFSGTFDGDGHTITANISGTGSMALFYTLNGGTIKNLTVAGSISGNNHTAALLVSLGNGGTNIIENCVVTADVTSSGTHMGGFLAHGNNSNITIRGCVFKGKMTGGSSAKGVFYGWGDNGGTGSVTDCLYIMASGQDTDGLDLTKGSGTVTVNNCYKTASAGSQGRQAYASFNAPATLGSLVRDYGMVKVYQNSLLYDGKYYVAQTAVLNITSPSVGQVIGSDGKNYNYANLPSGVTPVAKIFYLEENRGLALAMSDESGTMQQTPAKTTCASHKAPFAGGTWKLASKDEWETMISAAGDYRALRNGFAGVGGTDMLADIYWSSTDGNFFSLGLNNWWDDRPLIYDAKGNFYVRACLEFSLLPIEEIEIGSTDDWNTFVENVNNGDSYINKHVKLTNDISVSTPVGSRANENSNRPFRGIFDGGGHTITVTFADDGNSGMAPFRYIGSATIKNLKVAGTIASSQQHTSGVVGYASGNNLIENCVVTATLNISSNYAGGIIGHGLNSITTIQGCAFTGTINGVDGNRGNVGGIWGWSDNATPTLVNCLEAGTYTNIASMHPMGLQSTSGTIADSYYLNAQMGEPSNACTVRGAKRAEAHATAPDDFGDMLADYGMVQAYANGILFGGTYYVVYNLSGTGTENDPYIIANTDDWNLFATNVNGGDDYSGQFVKLTADISVSSMAGASDANSFQGTFDGDGHTLTFTKGTAQSAFGEERCAPFRYVKNATIKNLCVEGDIYTSRMYAAGLVSQPSGTLTITDCHVSTVIHSSVSGDGTHGGIVARLGNATSTTISGCLFDGRLLTTNGTTSCGGIVGWHDSKTFSITNTLYAPNASITAASGETPINDGATIIRGGSLAEGATCYYTETLGTAQGTQVCTAAPEGEISKVITLFNTTVYSASVCTVSGLSAICKISQAASITPVVAYGNTTLTFATDYTATLDGVAVNALPVSIGTVGEHTLILTGTGNYTGAKTIEIVTLPDANSDFTMTDGDTYTIIQDCDVATATYRKTTDRVGKYHPWLVPFDYTITAADLEKFTFYKINMIANSPDPDDEATGAMWMFVKKMAAGDVLRGNMPYVFKPKQAVTDYDFTTAGATLKAKADGARITMMTAENTYTLYGTYEPTSPSASDQFYYMNINGNLSLGNDGTVTVGAFRWIMRVENKFGSNAPAAYARNIIIFDGEETTGIRSIDNGQLTIGDKAGEWFTLDGRRLSQKPSRAGVYINNGIKIVIK